ncbi:MAG: hypothetical protein J1E80_01130 [Desulfovibrionaceae bacterium]|nr:hypothetical protein [Desulfovibrionaceae bacterium]
MMRACAAPFVLLALLLLPHAALGGAPAYGGLKLDIRPPVGFADATQTAPRLFQATQDEAVPDGVLLRLYLPDDDAQRYAEGRPEEVTRQVSLYAVKDGENQAWDRKALELMARSLEGAWAGYEAVPDEALKDWTALNSALLEAGGAGTPLLLEPIHSEHAEGRVFMQVFGTDAPVAALMATCAVLVNDRVLFVTASSLISDPFPADDAAWVKASAEAFAEALVSAEKK